MPELEALAPLRALLVSIARPDEATVWSSSGPYLTLGKRGVHPDELRRRMPQALHRITEHLQALFKAYVEALECQQRADAPGVVAALVRAGRLEEEVGRHTQARTWYEVALRVAEALQDRRPEVEVLRALGYVCVALGEYAASARHFQRSLALAEAEFDQAGATAASEGLGDVAVAQGQWGGAQAWYSRGLRLAEAASDAPHVGRLERQLGVLARKQRDLAAAGEFLRRARERFEAAGPPDEMARVLNEQGRLDAQLGRYTAASAAYREALAWAQRAPRDARLELSIRLNLAELDLEAGRLLAAGSGSRTKPAPTSNAPGSSSTRSGKRSSASALRRSSARCPPDRRLVVGQRILPPGGVGLGSRLLFLRGCGGRCGALGPRRCRLGRMLAATARGETHQHHGRGRQDGSRHGTLRETGFGSNITTEAPAGGCYPRSLVSGRVRHVGPPPPLRQISRPANSRTVTPARSSRARVSRLPATISTSRGATASTLHPSVSNSGSATSTSSMPRESSTSRNGTGMSGA